MIACFHFSSVVNPHFIFSQVFIGFVLKQFEYIEVGQFR